MKFLILLSFICIVKCYKFLWDGDEYTHVNTEKILKQLSGSEFTLASTSGNGKKITNNIDVYEHIIFKNIKIVEFDVTSTQNNFQGFLIVEHSYTDKDQIIATEYETEGYLSRTFEAKCHLAQCEIGLLLLEKYHTNPNDILNYRITDFYGAFYIKLVTSSREFKLGKITINSNKFPLILCPYKHWVGRKSGVKYIPYEIDDPFIYSIKDRHSMQPAIQRIDDSSKFICGDLIYADNSELRIIYEYTKNSGNEMEIGNINVINDKWICQLNMKPENYFHYAYNEHNFTMRYISYEHKKTSSLYYNEILYMYNLQYKNLGDLQRNGVKFGDILNEVEPSCASRLTPLPATPNLYMNNILVTFDNKGNDYKILKIEDDMLNKKHKFHCHLSTYNATEHPYVSNYYDNGVTLSLVRHNDNGTFENVEYITFTEEDSNGFGRYECLIKDDYNKDSVKLMNVVKKISFNIIPNLGKRKFKWQNKKVLLISCPNRYSNFATLHEMVVEVVGAKTYNHKKEKSFFDTSSGKDVIFKHNKLVENKVKFGSLTTKCVYISVDGVIFTITNDNQIIEKGDETPSGIKNLTLYLAIGIGAFILFFLILIIIVIVIRKRNRMKKNNLKGSKNSLSTSLSGSKSDTNLNSKSGKPNKKVVNSKDSKQKKGLFNKFSNQKLKFALTAKQSFASNSTSGTSMSGSNISKSLVSGTNVGKQNTKTPMAGKKNMKTPVGAPKKNFVKTIKS